MYHWVNKDKDAAHLSRSEGSSAALIHRFVRAQRSKDADVPGTTVWSADVQTGGRSSLASPNASSTPTRRITKRERRFSDSTRRKRNDATSAQSLPAVPFDDTDALESKTDEECAGIVEELLRRLFDTSHVHSANLVEGSAFDPFASTAAPITKNIHSTLTYFWIHAPQGLHHYKLEVLPKHLRPFQDSLNASRETILGCVFTCKHVFYSILAAFESRRMIESGGIVDERSTIDNYIAMSIASIRDKLAERQSHLDTTEPATLSLVIGIQYLAVATGLNQRLSEINFHLQALMTLARDLRSHASGTVEHWLLDGAASVCTLAAVKTGTPTLDSSISESARLDEGRLAAMKLELELLPQQQKRAENIEEASVWSAESPLQGPRSRHNLESLYAPGIDMLADASLTLIPELGSGFESALALESIDPRLRSTLRDVLDNLTVVKYVWRLPERCDSELTKSLCQSNRKVLNQLTSIDLQAEPVTLSGMPPLPRARYVARMARCVRFALVIMVSCASYRIGRICCQTNAPRLKEALLDLERLTDNFSMSGKDRLEKEGEHQMTHEGVEDTKLLLWVLMTGHFASQGMLEEEWFATRASSIAASRLELRSYADLHQLMSGYLYSWTVQERSLRIVTDLICPP